MSILISSGVPAMSRGLAHTASLQGVGFGLVRRAAGALPAVAKKVVEAAPQVQGFFLSSSPALHTKIHATLPEECFFNRNQEIEDIKGVLRKKPAFSVFLGPPNTGKTALLTKVLSEVNTESNTPVVYINLRGGSVATPEMLYDTLAGSFATGWKEQLKALLKGVPLREFSSVVQTVRELTNAIFGYKDMPRESLPVSVNPVAQRGYMAAPPMWSRHDLFSIMELFANKKYLVYRELVEIFDKNVIDSLIQHHILHLRPRKKFTYDIPGIPNEPIVTPVRYAGHLAMKMTLKALKGEREKARRIAAARVKETLKNSE